MKGGRVMLQNLAKVTDNDFKESSSVSIVRDIVEKNQSERHISCKARKRHILMDM